MQVSSSAARDSPYLGHGRREHTNLPVSPDLCRNRNAYVSQAPNKETMPKVKCEPVAFLSPKNCAALYCRVAHHSLESRRVVRLFPGSVSLPASLASSSSQYLVFSHHPLHCKPAPGQVGSSALFENDKALAKLSDLLPTEHTNEQCLAMCALIACRQRSFTTYCYNTRPSLNQTCGRSIPKGFTNVSALKLERPSQKKE